VDRGCCIAPGAREGGRDVSRRRAPPCFRIDPRSGETIEVLKGYAYAGNRVRFWRRAMGPKLAAALAQARFREVGATPAAPLGNACQRAPEASD
jgi:hypothetical protein